MNKFFIYLTLVLFFSQQLAQSQNLKDKNVLIVWGGWEGNKPEKFSNIIESWLNDISANVRVENSLDIYSNYDQLIKFDLIIQSITQSSISPKQ